MTGTQFYWYISTDGTNYTSARLLPEGQDQLQTQNGRHIGQKNQFQQKRLRQDVYRVVQIVQLQVTLNTSIFKNAMSHQHPSNYAWVCRGI